MRQKSTRPVPPERLARLAEMRATKAANVERRRREAELRAAREPRSEVEVAALTAEYDAPAAVEMPSVREAAPRPVREEPEPPRPTEAVLSQEEVDAIYAAARAQVEKEKRDALKAKVRDQALDEARRAGGLITQQTEYDRWLDEEIDVPIVLPKMRMPNGRTAPPDPLRVDQVPYYDGHIVRVNRAKAMTLLSMMWQLKAHAAQVDGRSRHYFDEGLGKVVYMGGPAGTGFGNPGVSFDGIHKRPAT